jgi:ERCC4-type nuclease
MESIKLEQSRMEQKLDDIEKTLEDIFSNIPGIEYLRYTNYFDKKKEVIIL